MSLVESILEGKQGKNMGKNLNFFIIGSVPDARKYMRETFSGFCSNKDNQLIDFWDSVCQEFEKKEEKRRKEEEEQNEIKRQIEEEIDSISLTSQSSSNANHF